MGATGTKLSDFFTKNVEYSLGPKKDSVGAVSSYESTYLNITFNFDKVRLIKDQRVYWINLLKETKIDTLFSIPELENELLCPDRMVLSENVIVLYWKKSGARMGGVTPKAYIKEGEYSYEERIISSALMLDRLTAFKMSQLLLLKEIFICPETELNFSRTEVEKLQSIYKKKILTATQILSLKFRFRTENIFHDTPLFEFLKTITKELVK